MLYFMAFILVTANVQGKPPLEVSAVGGVQDLYSYGVDAESCKCLVYQVKNCMGHWMLLLDRDGELLVRFLTGGFGNTKSTIIVYPAENEISATIHNVLHCDEYRWLWMSWGAGRIKCGTGRVPGENTILDMEDPTGSQVKRIALSRANELPSTIRLGETERGRFARVMQEGKFSDGMISETSTSRETCARLCSDHLVCGMFSYNQGLGLCAIFDRMTSSFTLTSEEGWRSWKLLYCYP